MIRRREFITLLVGAAAWPVAGRAQQPDQMRRVGVLMGWTENDPEFRSWLAAFVQEFARLGWVDGANVRIDQRWTNYDPARTQRFAKELVELQPDVILTGATPATAALHQLLHCPNIVVQFSSFLSVSRIIYQIFSDDFHKRKGILRVMFLSG
jgi:putative ABC transport system substrate-binding protein